MVRGEIRENIRPFQRVQNQLTVEANGIRRDNGKVQMIATGNGQRRP